jgi:hypothetical protein
MKNVFLFIGFLLVIANCLIGLILTSYLPFNWLSSSALILINTLFLYYISNSKTQDGFKVALSFIFPVLGLASFILSLKLKNKLENNTVLVLLISIITIQLLLLIITNYLKTIKK